MKKIAFLIFSIISFSSCSQSLMKINDTYKNIEVKEKRLFIDSIKVFEGDSERVLYEIFNNRYVVVSLFDKVKSEIALSTEYLGKNEVYIIDINESENIYKGQLGGVTGKQILNIDLAKKLITIKDFEGQKQELKLTLQK